MTDATDLRETAARLSRGLLAVAALAIVGLAFLGTAAASAGPARYVYETCDSALPGGGDPGAQFFVNPGIALSPSDSCAQPGGALGITETGPVSSTYSFWSVPGAAPPGGKMESFSITAAVCTGGNPAIVAWAYAREWANSCHDEVRTYPVNSSFILGFDIWLGCDGNYPGGCQAGPWVSAHYFAATEEDPVPPSVANLAGTLLGGGVIRGHQTLSADAHDKGGGVSNVSVAVNGLPAAQPKVTNCQLAQVNNRSVIGTVATAVIPCPTDTSASWTLDTGAYPFHNGANSVSVCASDFATLGDPNTTCSAPQSVNVDNSCTESSVPGGQLLSASFAQSNDDTVTVAYGQGAVVEGKLASNAGDPVAGATICVKSQTLGVDAAPASVGVAKTDNSGHYAYQVPPGPNRELMVGYRHDSSQVARDVSYFSHAQPSLNLSPRKVKDGHRIKLWGSLPGPNAGGRVVVLQASAPGTKRWLTFRKATTGDGGNFASHYKFSRTTRPITYKLRAFVPTQANYPWVGGAGKPVRVRVVR
jgi:hypothetical protein